MHFYDFLCMYLCMHSVEKREILSHSPKKNFVKSTLVIYLVKPLLSRKFCQKYVREKFRNFHTVCAHSLENRKILSLKKIRETTSIKSFTFTKFLSKTDAWLLVVYFFFFQFLSNEEISKNTIRDNFYVKIFVSFTTKLFSHHNSVDFPTIFSTFS